MVALKVMKGGKNFLVGMQVENKKRKLRIVLCHDIIAKDDVPKMRQKLLTIVVSFNFQQECCMRQSSIRKISSFQILK